MLRLFFGLLLFLSSATHAENIYAPAICDFSIAFPESYYERTLCQEGNKFDCQITAKFTTSINDGYLNADASCSKLSDGLYRAYNQKITESLAGEILTKHGLNKAQYSFYHDEKKNFKNMTAIAEGVSAQNIPVFLIIQLWAREKSFLTLEIKMTGQHNEEIQKIAAQIMHSLKIQDTSAEGPSTEAVPNP